MPHFFYEAFPDLVWLGYDPDRWKGAGPSIDSANEPDHYLDYEYIAHLTPLPAERYKFVDLFYRSGTAHRKGIRVDDPGFLPWRIAEICELLTKAWREWRFSAPGSRDRKVLERDIIHYAGILGHYVGDSANPHHTTIHYNGWAAPNPKRYAIDCDTHARFESQFVSRAATTADVTPKVLAPVLRTEYFATAQQAILASNSLLEQLYTIDRDGGFAPLRPISPEAKTFTTDRLAAGAALVRDLWWSTWKNSLGPRPSRPRS